MVLYVSHGYAAAMGDIRTLGAGDFVWVLRDARQRIDWARYVDAIAHAVSRGAEVRWA